MNTKSRKSKGRRLQQYVAQKVREVFNLHSRDVRSTSMGAGGADVTLSEKAAKAFPWSVECKNTERLDLWGSWNQAKDNADELSPLLVVKRNMSDTLAIMDFDKFMEIVCQNKTI